MLLLRRDDAILALDCGFQSQEVFCRAFRRCFGTTPGAYHERGIVIDVNNAKMEEHAAFVRAIGHCVGLYHMNHEMKAERNDMRYSITRKDLLLQPVLVVRRRVKRSGIAAAIGEALPHVFQYAQQHGIPLAGLPFTRYLHVGPGLLTIEPGMRIAAPERDPNTIDPAWTKTSTDAEVVLDKLSGGQVATTTHQGPYENLSDAYAALQEWIEAHGLKTAGAPWECYVTDPGDNPDPKDWKTNVFWPVSG